MHHMSDRPICSNCPSECLLCLDGAELNDDQSSSQLCPAGSSTEAGGLVVLAKKAIIRQAGYSVYELQQLGDSASELPQAGYRAAELRQAGYSTSA